MKTPFTSKGDMVSELQTAQHYIQKLVHHSYDIGFAEGCRYCEKVIYDRVLEIIDSEGVKLQLGGYGAIPKYYVKCIKNEIEKLRG